jgi:hypothetical protein
VLYFSCGMAAGGILSGRFLLGFTQSSRVANIE